MSKLRKTARLIINSISIILLLVGILVFVLILTSSKQGIPSFFGYSFMQVSSESMLPVYKKGDLLLIEKTEWESLKVSDDICFFSTDPKIKGLPNTHRIHEIKTDENGEEYFVTKGVANIKPDDYSVYDDQLIGKVVGSSTFFGKVFKVIATPGFMFFAIAVPLIAIIFTEIMNIRKIAADRKDNSGKQEDKTDK